MMTSAPAATALGRSPEIFDAAVGYDRNVIFSGDSGAVGYGGYLRHADTGHDPGGADGTWADTDLDGISTGLDQRFGRISRGNVAGDQLYSRESFVLIARTASITPWEWPWAVSITMTSTPALIRASTRASMSAVGPTAASDPEPAQVVLAGIGIFPDFLDILDGDQTFEISSLSTTSSFSTRVCFRCSFASSSVVPTGDGDQIASWSCGQKSGDPGRFRNGGHGW